MFPWFPYSNFHRLNADWILKTVQTMYEQVTDALQRVNTAVQSITDCVKVTAQNFTASEKAQARSNIGAAATSDIPNVSDVVRTSPQALSNAEKVTARSNIGAAATTDLSDVVRTSPQTLSDVARAQARNNIKAAATSDIYDVVRTSPQTLSTSEKTTARSNIGAAGTSDIPNVSDVVRSSPQTLSTSEKTTARSNIGAAGTEDTDEIRNQTIRFVEASGPYGADVVFPNATQVQIEYFREFFNLLNKISPEAWYSIALFGQDVDSEPGWPRVRLERVEDGNGAYFKISQRASLESSAGNVDCRLSGVAAPVDANDAVNKAYADALKPFVITVTLDNGTYTADKTDLQIEDAINANRQIIVSYSGGKYYCNWAFTENHEISLVAGFCNTANNTAAIITYDNPGSGWTEYAQ